MNTNLFGAPLFFLFPRRGSGRRPKKEFPEFCARIVPLNPPPAPPRRGATPAGEFPSWEGSGVGWLAPGSWAERRMGKGGVSGFPIVACPAIHYATPEDRRRYDILQSIRTLTLLEDGHPEQRSR